MADMFFSQHLETYDFTSCNEFWVMNTGVHTLSAPSGSLFTPLLFRAPE